MNSPRVLVVEDEAVVSLDIQNTLKELGYQVAGSAMTGEDAVRLTRQEQPDLVLMDIVLRGPMTGIDAVRIINDSMSVPVVYLTSHSDPKTVEQASETSPQGYLLKPFENREMFAAIEMALFRHQLELRLKEREQTIARLNQELEQRVLERTAELEEANRSLNEEVARRELIEAELRRTLEQEKEVNRLKSQFLRTASHEFRTPLSIILSSSDLMEVHGHRWDDAKRRAVCQRIGQAVQDMTGLLTSMLTLNTVQDEHMQTVRQPVELVRLCESIVAEARSRAGERRLGLKVTGAVRPAWLDERITRQGLEQLVANALKYTGAEGSIEIELRWLEEAVEIVVSDDGLGIPAEEQGQIFEPFFRGSNTGAVRGVGLGLSIARRTAETQGGQLLVKSLPGEGSVFTMRLPQRELNR